MGTRSAASVRIDLPLDHDAPAAARHMLREILTAWRVDADEVVDVCLLVASELVTNAVVHGGGQVAFEAQRREDVLRLAVSDGSSVLPGRRLAGPLDTSGRGLALIEALALTWGVEDTGEGSRPDGKRVWVNVKY